MFNIYQNKKVLVTGHTGFKGSWLISWLRMIGADVVGISLPESIVPSLFSSTSIEDQITDYRIDIRDQKLLKE